jgi:SpoVK/Ycf46/Vps4 family AAA+-type ATPase
MNLSDNKSIEMNDIAGSLKCNKIQLLKYMDDFDELERKQFIRCRRSVNGRKNRKEAPTYRVPMEVIEAIRKGIVFIPPVYKNISIENLFDALDELMQKRIDGELAFEPFINETRDLINNNMHLEFCRKIKWYQLDEHDVTTLFRFCDLYVNQDDDKVGMHDLEDIYDDRRNFRHMVEQRLVSGDSCLIKQHGLIENVNEDGLADPGFFHLTEKAKNELLSELDLKNNMKKVNNLIKVSGIAKKNLFYNGNEARQIEELTSLLREENFSSIQNRLSENSMRKGFACLFYGPPGTGKTETVYQIARKTGRDIMMVDISETKSCWFGESEKRIKNIFDSYRGLVKSSSIVPILLFNEADAVIGRKMEFNGDARSITQTENTIQNIILQEIENLDGILIATTNLAKNLDKAFERRFLYKIEFGRPSTEARTSIWQSILPSLSRDSAVNLASQYNFSGGQIENVARKSNVEKILHGVEPSFDKLKEFCNTESFSRENNSSRIGFGN